MTESKAPVKITLGEELQESFADLEGLEDGLYSRYYYDARAIDGPWMNLLGKEDAYEDFIYNESNGSKILFMVESGKESEEAPKTERKASKTVHPYDASRRTIANQIRTWESKPYRHVVLHALFPFEGHTPKTKKDELIWALIARLDQKDNCERFEEALATSQFVAHAKVAHDLFKAMVYSYLEDLDAPKVEGYRRDLIIFIHNIGSYTDQEHAKDVLKTLWEIYHEVPERREIWDMPDARWPRTFRVFFAGAGVKELIESLHSSESDKEKLVFTPKVPDPTSRPTDGR